MFRLVFYVCNVILNVVVDFFLFLLVCIVSIGMLCWVWVVRLLLGIVSGLFCGMCGYLFIVKLCYVWYVLDNLCVIVLIELLVYLVDELVVLLNLVVYMMFCSLLLLWLCFW